MSDAVIIAIIGALATVIVGLPSLIAIFLNHRLSEQKIALESQSLQIKSQGEEQTRLAATATRLAEEAKERAETRKAEREADRQSQADTAQRLKEAADYYQKRWEDEAAITNSQRAEIAGLTKQVIDAIGENYKLQQQYARSDRDHSEDIERLKKKTEDYDKLRGQLDSINGLLTAAQDTIKQQQTAFNKMTDRFDDDIKRINQKNAEIIENLQGRVRALETENGDLRNEVAKLRADLKTFTEPPTPTPPDHKAAIPGDESVIVALPQPTDLENVA